MKLRLLDDSIRMRLSRSEVDVANQSGVVEGQTRFPDGSMFRFALEADKGEAGPSAAYESDRMVVRLPASEIAAWAGDDTAVSLRGELDLPAGGPLRLLVEKDFQCVTPREGEDQSDLFTNPQSC
jgi:hypothetical protein